jgi:uncharacterized protein HemX
MTEHEDQADETGEHSGDETESGPETDTTRPAGSGLALVALLVALLAGAAAGWAGWQTWQSHEAGGDEGERLTALSGRVDELGNRIDSLRDEVTAAGERARAVGEEAGAAGSSAVRASERADALESTVSDLAGEVAALQQTVNEQRRRIETLTSRLDGSGGPSPDLALALSQAEYLVHTAYRMLELEGDPERARRAMSLALERLRGLEAPGLTRAREAVAGELEALRGVSGVDREGLAARLAGLADTVGDLPLRGDLGPASAGPANEPGRAETREDERGWWQATRDFMGEYFTVRRTDETGTSLPAPGSLSLMRDVLRLALEQARLSLLRAETGLYRQSLERADALLAAYFADDDPAVVAARETLAELEDTDIEPRRPDLGAALDALRAANPGTTESS